MNIVARTHIGNRRQKNEDGYYVPSKQDASFVVVADGMGGHNAGETASRMAIEAVVHTIQEVGNPDEAVMMQAVRDANANIWEKSQQVSGLRGMGTTLVMALLRPQQVLIANVGDSRAYHLSDQGLRQVTRDHSLVEELVRRGRITRQQASTHPHRNIITRAVGIQQDVSADLFELEWSDGDCLLLCSDGLSNELSIERMERILKEKTQPEQAADALLQAALDAGGYDNITLLIAKNTSEVQP